jgi:L-2-hydroxyglutarate oxidase LhgO
MDILVIGAGVIGLACAAELARRGNSVVVAEAAGTIGSGISSRNSEVVHGGMYYLPGSLRADHCVAGRRKLYAYCAARGVTVAKPGKLIVATTEAETAKLHAILANGQANGVEDLTMLTGPDACALEPALTCVAALLSPQTGIVDSHGLMLALQGELEDHGGSVALTTHVLSMAPTRAGWAVQIASGGSPPDALVFDAVVNAAGLSAQKIARATAGFPAALIPRQVLAKGNYFGYRGKPVFRHLIYPAPVDGGLGTHVTLDLAGRMRFGPDVEWIDRESYDVDPARAGVFTAAIRRYFPALPNDSLVPDYAGIRPKLTGPGETPADFIICGPNEHGQDRAVHLFGIESPGLTASLSLAGAAADTIHKINPRLLSAVNTPSTI